MAKKKDQDEIIVDVNEVYTRTELFVDRNRKLLTIVLGVAIAVVALGAGYYYLIAKPKEQKAAENSWKAMQYFELDSIDLALYGDGLYPGLEDIIAEHSGTKAAARSHYAMAVIARDRGEFEDAIAHFNKVDVDDDVVSVLALAGAGDCQIDLDQIEEGVKSFERGLSRAKGNKAESLLAPTLHYKAGIAYLELDNKDKALKHFEAIVKDYPKSQNFAVAERYAAYLGKK